MCDGRGDATPDNVHMRAAVAFALYLGDAQRAGYGQVGIPRRNVALDYAERGMRAEDVVEPEVFFVVRERLAILEARPVRAAPDIVVEVLSTSTAAADLPSGNKFDAYERYGVRFYWLVDTEAQTVTQYERRADQLVAVATLRPGDTLRCPLFPEFGLALDDVFQREALG